jgi:hypothetical protein
MELTVWVDSWQMQCCGEPFHVGSEISWTLRARDLRWLEGSLGRGQTADAAEEHHGGVPEGTEPTRGTVTGIKAVHCRFAAKAGGGSGIFYPVQGSAVLADVESADGWIADRDDERFVGYLVKLTA